MIFEHIKRIRLWQLLAIIAVIAALLAFLLPTRTDIVNPCDTLMKNIYRKVLDGESRQTIENSLSTKEKELINKYSISWLESIPIETEFGTLNLEHLPSDHVVVYGTPELKARKIRWFEDAYINANGSILLAMKGLDIPLEKLVKTTCYGTSEILKGHISDISEISDSDMYQEDAIYEYLLLKKLIIKSPDYPQFAFESVMKNFVGLRYHTEQLLRDSIKSPPLPEGGLGRSGDDFEVWENWYKKNAGKIKFTNGFLFQAPSSEK